MWYVVDMFRDGAPGKNLVLRGPFKYPETAGAVRAEMERWASGQQNERWNLGVVFDYVPA
jgi:hypothetical protein